jgi:hypothetical protein
MIQQGKFVLPLFGRLVAWIHNERRERAVRKQEKGTHEIHADIRLESGCGDAQ